MPTNLETAVSKLLHPSNSKNFSQQDRDSIQAHYPPFPMVEFLRDELTPEFEDDDLSDPIHGEIMDTINGEGTFQDKYNRLVYEYVDGCITTDEFMVYGRKLSKHEAAKQVSENPGTTGKSTPKVSKLPSQDVNCVTCSGSANTRMRGILGIGFIRTIASKLLVKRGNKDKS